MGICPDRIAGRCCRNALRRVNGHVRRKAYALNPPTPSEEHYQIVRVAPDEIHLRYTGTRRWPPPENVLTRMLDEDP